MVPDAAAPCADLTVLYARVIAQYGVTLRAGLNRPDSTATTCRTPAVQAGVRLCRQNRLSVIRFVPILITKGSNGTSHRESSRGTARSWELHDQTLGPERQGPNNPDRRRPSSGRGFRDRAVARPPTTCGTSARDRPVRRRIVGRFERTQSSLGIHRQVRVDGLLAQIRLRVGDQVLTAVITADAVRALKLRRGDDAIAIVKSTEVMIARPSRPSTVRADSECRGRRKTLNPRTRLS